jgi:hypothetical protein
MLLLEIMVPQSVAIALNALIAGNIKPTNLPTLVSLSSAVVILRKNVYFEKLLETRISWVFFTIGYYVTMIGL